MINFHIERLDPLMFVGWAYDSASEESVTIRIRVGGEDVDIPASRFRPDLRFGKADGLAGFYYEFPPDRFIDPDVPIRVSSTAGQLDIAINSERQAAIRRSAGCPLLVGGPARCFSCVIVAIIKDEASYIPEWIEYHRSIGFEHFVIFNNDSTDDIRGVVAPYQALGVATLIDWPNFQTLSAAERRTGWFEQDVAYGAAVRFLRDVAEWVAFIDIDEFIVLKDPARQSIQQIVAGLGVPAMPMYWRNFGSSGLVEPRSHLVIEQYVMRGHDDVRASYKMIVRPDRLHTIWNAHRVTTAPGFVAGEAEDGTIYHKAEPFVASFGRACIHHYHTRSKSEYMRKARRGWPVNTPEKNDAWERNFAMHDKNDVRDESLLPYVPVVSERLERIRDTAVRTPETAAPGWLQSFPKSLIFDAYPVTRNGRPAIAGYLFDFLNPDRKHGFVLRDEFGATSQHFVADQRSEVLVMNRVMTGNFGFCVDYPGFVPTQLVADGLVIGLKGRGI
jgi:hypothetical protein